jgi:hypothetical protein
MEVDDSWEDSDGRLPMLPCLIASSTKGWEKRDRMHFFSKNESETYSMIWVWDIVTNIFDYIYHITMIWGHKWGYYVSGTHCQVPFLNLGCVLVTCRTCLKWGFNRETVEMKASNIGIITNMC